MSKATLFADLRIIIRHLNKLPSQGVNSFKAHTMAQVWFRNIYVDAIVRMLACGA